MSLTQAIRGVQDNPTGGNPFTVRGGRAGDLFTSSYHGRYYQIAKDGKLFTGASQTVVTTTVGLATTYTGLVLSNPISSSVNLAVTKCSYMQSVVQAVQIEAFALATGYNATTNVTHTTPVTPKNCFIGTSGVGTGLVDSSATLPTAPTYTMFVQNTPTSTSNASGTTIDLEGSIILPPGGYIAWVTPGQASVAGMWFSFVWEEFSTS